MGRPVWLVAPSWVPIHHGNELRQEQDGNPAGGAPSSNYADGDKPGFVAGLVLQAIEEGQAHYFANDRLRKMAGVAA